MHMQHQKKTFERSSKMTGPKTKPDPLYVRVKQHIRDQIARGDLKEGSKLPSEFDLMTTLGVSRMTVHRAMRELSESGLISRVQGIGSFIAKSKPRVELLEIRDIADDIAANGHVHHCKVVKLESIRADFDRANIFGIRVGGRLFHSIIVHFEQDEPVQMEERFVSPGFAPAYVDQDFEALGVTTTTYLQGIAKPTEVEHVVFAENATEELSELLQMERSQAVLKLMRRTWVNEVPVTLSFFTYPSDRYSLGARYRA